MQSILEVKGVSKKFIIKHKDGGYLSIRDSLVRIFKAEKWQNETFWALSDINFNVDKGDSLAIIGRNGAGKSTLLKILSKITPPDKGSIICRGRVSSLLEVGTGFHPELSGRENIYFNGSLLGMKRAEIDRKFDEIVDFSGTENFLDTALKHYSSGMQLRLAFSVAAFLESEILILDEVLAVGDAEFQKKCLGKMDDVTKSGRTILFVSHNLSAVENLCNKAILLDKGKIIREGSSGEIVEFYQSKFYHESGKKWTPSESKTSDAYFSRIELDLEGDQPDHRLKISFDIKSNAMHKKCFIAFDIHSSSGATVMQSIPQVEPFINFSQTQQTFEVEIDLPPMIPGFYSVSAWMGPHNSQTFVWEKEIIGFEITESPTKNRSFPHYSKNGFIVPNTRIINEKSS